MTERRKSMPKMPTVQISIAGAGYSGEQYEMTDEAHTYLCRFASILQDMNVDLDDDAIEKALEDLE